MKIGKFVQLHAPAILEYCENNPAEFAHLQDPQYCKAEFDLNYPFCRAVSEISDFLDRRFYKTTLQVLGTDVRVTNHWFEPAKTDSYFLLRKFMEQRRIPTECSLETQSLDQVEPT